MRIQAAPSPGANSSSDAAVVAGSWLSTAHRPSGRTWASTSGACRQVSPHRSSCRELKDRGCGGQRVESAEPVGDEVRMHGAVGADRATRPRVRTRRPARSSRGRRAGSPPPGRCVRHRRPPRVGRCGSGVCSPGTSRPMTAARRVRPSHAAHPPRLVSFYPRAPQHLSELTAMRCSTARGRAVDRCAAPGLTQIMAAAGASRSPKLGTYRRKRDFTRTPEPSGSPPQTSPEARGASSSNGTVLAACITTCASRSTACSRAGRCRRARPSTRQCGAPPSTSRTTRSSTSTSKGSSRPASTAAAT